MTDPRSATTGAPASDLWEKAAILIALTICMVHFGGFDVREHPLKDDLRFYAYFSWQVAEGAVPHVDYFDMKNQLTVFVGALFYTVGSWLDIDQLFVMRRGFLLLALAGGICAYFVHRRIGGGRPMVGLLGVLAYCSMTVIGDLPAIAPVPKLFMALFSYAAALFVLRKRWIAAGACGGLAYWDWQIGALVWLGVFVAALWHERPRRPALTKVVIGGFVGFLPLLLYFLFQGALIPLWEQTIAVSAYRGGERMETGLNHRINLILVTASTWCPSQKWLVVASIIGLDTAVRRLWNWRTRPEHEMYVTLCVYHFGVIGFSLLDFQGPGDLMILAHSLVFLQALLWGAIYTTFAGGLTGASLLARAGLAAGFLVVTVFATKPGPLRRGAVPLTKNRNTLTAQREVANQALEIIGDGSVAALRDVEYLFLMRKKNALPFMYYTPPVLRHFAPTAENFEQGATILLSEVDPDYYFYKDDFEGEGADRLKAYSKLELRSTSLPHMNLLIHMK